MDLKEEHKKLEFYLKLQDSARELIWEKYPNKEKAEIARKFLHNLGEYRENIRLYPFYNEREMECLMKGSFSGFIKFERLKDSSFKKIIGRGKDLEKLTKKLLDFLEK